MTSGRDKMAAAYLAFDRLSRDEQRATIRRMAVDGWSDHGIAHATRLAVEQIRALLAVPAVDGDAPQAVDSRAGRSTRGPASDRGPRP